MLPIPKKAGTGPKTLVAGLAAFVCVSLATSVAVRAEALVIGSNLPVVRVGTLLDASVVVEVKAGQTLRLMLPSGRSKVIKGPEKAAIGELTRNQTRNEKIWNKVLAMVSPKNEKPSSGQIGAVRGLAAPPAKTKVNAAVQAFSLGDVLIAGGKSCVLAGGDVAIRRDDAAAAESITLVDLADGVKAKVSFDAGVARVAWPKEVPLRTTSYALLSPGAAIRQLPVHLLEAEPATEEMIGVLLEAGCERQAGLLLSTDG